MGLCHADYVNVWDNVRVGWEKRHVMVNGVWQVHTFKYPEVVHNHYRYRDMIDNHNSLPMHPLSMEETSLSLHHTFLESSYKSHAPDLHSERHCQCLLLPLQIINKQSCHHNSECDIINHWGAIVCKIHARDLAETFCHKSGMVHTIPFHLKYPSTPQPIYSLLDSLL